MALDRGFSMLSKVVKVLNSFSYAIVFLFLLVMMILVTTDIILRSFLGLNIGGAIEINEYLLVLIGFLGLAQTQANKGHIAVELIVDRFSSSRKYFFCQINNIVMILFCILFIYAGAKKAVSAFAAGESNWFGTHILPVWFIRWVVPISLALLLLQLLNDIFQSGKNSRH